LAGFFRPRNMGMCIDRSGTESESSHTLQPVDAENQEEKEC